MRRGPKARLVAYMAAWRGDRRGAVAVTAAAASALLCVATAVTIDLGVLTLHTRKLQGATDLAALSAARDLAQADARALETVRANMAPETPAEVTTTLGVYTPDRALERDRRFVAGGATPNAVRVEATSPAPLFFSRLLLGRERLLVSRRATAAAAETPKAMFSLGSRLAALDGGLANQLLSGLTGSQVSLKLMDYQRLVDLDVNLLGFTDALAAELALQAGDYDRLLDTRLDAGRTLKVLDRLSGGRDGGALGKLTGAATGLTLRLGDLIGVDAQAPDGVREGLDATVSALDLVTALLETAAGERQIALNLDAPAGLADLNASLAIGERPNRSPWLTVTANGQPVIRTAQARLYLRARTAQTLSGLAQVDLPILIELAGSEARLQRLSCRPGRSVEIGVRPGLARAFVGEIDIRRLGDFKTALSPRPATLVSVLGLGAVTARADIEAADTGFRPLTFDAADIAGQRTRTATSRNFVSGLAVSLLQRLEVTAAGLNLGGLTRALGQLLTPLGPVLDGAITPVLDLLGLKFGQADVTVHGLSCPAEGRTPPRLVG
ncbi:TadG family pilus assembly protein [Brevundimonas sp. SORGH_AS_0993]|uniref:TadG family pilus assembly protein n=1 Tax=Brevundimonas sp. SORGH_AS_0993 TaxID=3041794 RepID=UPI002789F4E7|nr:TadG family pilus assembly protein [Brevundimonas sp. SORGH_AS_0993]MDQ1155110.1 putative membrane protein [Brevundimonas sp. SORGH_AS_0993]